MKHLTTLLVGIIGLSLCSCATVYGPNGQQRQVMTPAGAAIIQTLVSTGIGAGSGSLMRNTPGWSNGMTSGGVGSIASQVVNAFVPQGGGSYNNNYNNGYQRQNQQAYYNNGYQQASYGGYQQRNNNSFAPQRSPVYYQRTDGSFVRAN